MKALKIIGYYTLCLTLITFIGVVKLYTEDCRIIGSVNFILGNLTGVVLCRINAIRKHA